MNTKYIYIILFIFILAFAGINLHEKNKTQKVLYVVSMTPEEMSAALKEGTIAGFISWEPNPAKAVSNGYGRYLINSKELWSEHPSCVMAISEFLKDEDMIKALVWMEVKSTRFINDPKNRDKVVNYASEFTGASYEAASIAIDNTEFTEFLNISETKKGYEILSEAGVFKESPEALGYNDLDELLANVILDKYYNEVRKKLEDDPEWIPPPVNGSLKFGYINGNIHHLAIYVAQKEGYFESIGLIPDENIHFLGFRNGLTITNAFNHREVDAAALGISPLLRYRVNDNGRVHIINGLNSGGTSLVVRADSDIESPDDLNGLTIATTGFSSIQDFLMRKMFEGFEIKTV